MTLYNSVTNTGLQRLGKNCSVYVHAWLLSTWTITQGCHGPGKISGKWHFFQVREFCGWPGKFRKELESQGKVRKFKNKWLWQAVFRKFTYSVQEGNGCTFSWDSLSPFPTTFGATLKGKNLLPWGPKQILSFKSSPKFEVIQFTPLKNRNDCFWSVRRYRKL